MRLLDQIDLLLGEDPPYKRLLGIGALAIGYFFMWHGIARLHLGRVVWGIGLVFCSILVTIQAVNLMFE